VTKNYAHRTYKIEAGRGLGGLHMSHRVRTVARATTTSTGHGTRKNIFFLLFPSIPGIVRRGGLAAATVVRQLGRRGDKSTGSTGQLAVREHVGAASMTQSVEPKGTKRCCLGRYLHSMWAAKDGRRPTVPWLQAGTRWCLRKKTKKNKDEGRNRET